MHRHSWAFGDNRLRSVTDRICGTASRECCRLLRHRQWTWWAWLSRRQSKASEQNHNNRNRVPRHDERIIHLRRNTMLFSTSRHASFEGLRCLFSNRGTTSLRTGRRGASSCLCRWWFRNLFRFAFRVLGCLLLRSTWRRLYRRRRWIFWGRRFLDRVSGRGRNICRHGSSSRCGWNVCW